MNKDEALRLALEALETSMYPQQKQLKAIPIIKQALEQPEPEPVANHELQCVCGAVWCGDEMVHPPNKTTPPKREWQGLTDVDVSKILDEQNGFYTFEKCFNFAKAIEAKLKERNT